MQQGSIVVLAIIIGLMLAFDMGGPVNKVAYAFMLICVAQGVYTVVAIAAVAICIPPLGLGPQRLSAVRILPVKNVKQVKRRW